MAYNKWLTGVILAHLGWLPYSLNAPLSWSWDFTRFTQWKFNDFSPGFSGKAGLPCYKLNEMQMSNWGTLKTTCSPLTRTILSANCSATKLPVGPQIWWVFEQNPPKMPEERSGLGLKCWVLVCFSDCYCSYCYCDCFVIVIIFIIFIMIIISNGYYHSLPRWLAVNTKQKGFSCWLRGNTTMELEKRKSCSWKFLRHCPSIIAIFSRCSSSLFWDNDFFHGIRNSERWWKWIWEESRGGLERSYSPGIVM